MSLDVSAVESWVDKFGKRNNRAKEVLLKILPGLNATLGTDVGKELLREDMDRYGHLLDKAAAGSLTQEESVEYVYLRNRLTHLVGKINQFLRLKSDLNK